MSALIVIVLGVIAFAVACSILLVVVAAAIWILDQISRALGRRAHRLHPLTEREIAEACAPYTEPIAVAPLRVPRNGQGREDLV